MNTITTEMAIEVIKILPKEYSSHQFIEKFPLLFESVYKNMIMKYNDDAIRNVHSQIGRFLVDNQELLGVEKLYRTTSRNFHGEETEVQLWVKK